MPEPDDPRAGPGAPRRAIVEEAEPVTTSTPASDGRRRLLSSLVKPGKGQLIAAAMLFLSEWAQ